MRHPNWKNPPPTSRILFFALGGVLLIFGLVTTVDRVRFFAGSVTMQGRVLYQQGGSVAVAPEGRYSIIWVERPMVRPRNARARKNYKAGRVVEIRADTTVVPVKAYMNSLYSLWFFPVGSILGGLLLLVLGYATPKPWKPEPGPGPR